MRKTRIRSYAATKDAATLAQSLPAQTPKYKAGDKVLHPLFGVGIVVSSRVAGGDDEEVEVAFKGKGI